MVTAAALVELIGPWADGADPLNEQLADALARAIEIDAACGDQAAGRARPRARAESHDDRGRLRSTTPGRSRTEPAGQRDLCRDPPVRLFAFTPTRPEDGDG